MTPFRRASVVFLRGVNVGGHKAFRPAVLARELGDFDVVNVGAAGTFVVRKAIGQTMLRAEFLRRLPFKAELMICPARAVIDFVSREPFPDESSYKDVSRYVTILAKRPRTLPSFPLSHPPGDQWQVKVLGVHGRFAPSL
ncbi:MAG: DUF1697 domain-containing protein, partial [Acidobacteria bacterium]|nr:DUF1697 domain-containing protein [Acidobacteriota bacterium]